MTKSDLSSLLDGLALSRPIFHSEADFQHELAFALRSENLYVRLEQPFDLQKRVKNYPNKCELDLLSIRESDKFRTAIELKYFRTSFSCEVDGEEFHLVNTWGTNLSRYDSWADFQRVQWLVDEGFASKGYSVVLTNASDAWQVNSETGNTYGKNFSLHQGRCYQRGERLDWHRDPTEKSIGAKRLSGSPISIPNDGRCVWYPYSRLINAENRNTEFRYLIFETR